MSWYTNIRYQIERRIPVVAAVSFAITTASSCISSVHDKGLLTKEFDFPSFFQQEIGLLNTLQPQVDKTVIKDSTSETKNLVIEDWNKELSSFLSIDLNKPAYRGAYQKDSADNVVIYTFTDSTLDLSSIRVVYKDHIPATLMIKKETKNLLYDTKESLEYVRGKRYSIDKRQNVKILGSHQYKIEGIIK